MTTPIPIPTEPWERFSDRFLLPDEIFYGERKISLRAIFNRAMLMTAVTAYRTIWEQYREEANEPTGEDGTFTAWDEGYAVGLNHALEVIRDVFALPIPETPLPPAMAPDAAALPTADEFLTVKEIEPR